MRTDRTVPNNKPDTIIRDNRKGRSMLINVAVPGDRNVLKKETKKILKCKKLYNRSLVHVEFEIKRDTDNNRVEWNHLKIT